MIAHTSYWRGSLVEFKIWLNKSTTLKMLIPWWTKQEISEPRFDGAWNNDTCLCGRLKMHRSSFFLLTKKKCIRVALTSSKAKSREPKSLRFRGCLRQAPLTRRGRDGRAFAAKSAILGQGYWLPTSPVHIVLAAFCVFFNF